MMWQKWAYRIQTKSAKDGYKTDCQNYKFIIRYPNYIKKRYKADRGSIYNMIIFDLECINSHTFEGWFDSKEDMDNQQAQGILTCPVCETNVVNQKLSAVAVRTKSIVPARKPEIDMKVVEEFGKKISEFVENNFENVGSKFTEEALKMHYGTSEARGIRGTTTKDEDKLLEKEGIQTIKVPLSKNPKEEMN